MPDKARLPLGAWPMGELKKRFGNQAEWQAFQEFQKQIRRCSVFVICCFRLTVFSQPIKSEMLTDLAL